MSDSHQAADEPEFVFPAEARHPALRRLFDYWQGKRRPGRLPGRKEVDPIEMTSFLRWVILIGVERQTALLRFKFRLIGTNVVELFGGDSTGSYLDETSSGDNLVNIHQRLSSIVETQRPVYGIRPVPRPNRDYIRYEHLTVPLAADGTTVDMLLGVRCGLPDG
jgi:hypothetical protein